MKLIIDIDEEQFKDIKRIAIVQMELNHYTTAEQIIAKGKVVPDNLQGDLISREALKKALIEAHINRVLTFDIATFNCVMNTIDNAPTVEPENERALDLIDSLKDRNAINNKERGILRRAILLNENTRPHGKWEEVPVKRDILHPNGIKYVCTECKRDNCYGKPPFCMWCGADMREDSDE